MAGGGPSFSTHSAGASSGVSAMVVPRLRREIVFFLLEMRAEDTPRSEACSKSVGAINRSAVSMYSSRPVFVSKYELPVIPCSLGNTPQQMDELFAFVTAGTIPFTCLYSPSRCHLRSAR